MAAEKCPKKCDVRAELLFCLSEPIAFLPVSLTSLSSCKLLNIAATKPHVCAPY